MRQPRVNRHGRQHAGAHHKCHMGRQKQHSRLQAQHHQQTEDDIRPVPTKVSENPLEQYNVQSHGGFNVDTPKGIQHGQTCRTKCQCTRHIGQHFFSILAALAVASKLHGIGSRLDARVGTTAQKKASRKHRKYRQPTQGADVGLCPFHTACNHATYVLEMV